MTKHWSKKLKSNFLNFFQIAELESSRDGKIGMEVGTMREKILTALLIYKFGEENINSKIPTTERVRFMETQSADIPLNYTTIKIRTTSSRVNKSLLAIPRSLHYLFPQDTDKIYLVDDVGNPVQKTFTPYSSKSKECRINGMREFYEKYNISEGDELIIQKLDNDIFRLLPELEFRRQYQQSLSLFENSQDEATVQQTLKETEKVANISSEKILENEFVKLANISGAPERKIKETKSVSRRESVPPYLRRILQSVYEGKCQITQFTFLMKNGNPYFEIHHIVPEWGNHIKNLLVVCPNMHAQFTHTNVEPYFDEEDGWLRRVSFNGVYYNVFQKIDVLHKTFTKEVHY